MTILRRALGALVLAGAAALLATGSAGARLNPAPPCAMTIFTNTTLTHDLNLSGVDTNGICFAASNITLNLNGHTVTGPTSSDGYYGIYDIGYSNDQVVNGNLKDWEIGVYFLGTTNARAQGLKITAPTPGGDAYGVYTDEAQGTVVKNVGCWYLYVCIDLYGISSAPGDASTNSNVSLVNDYGSLYGFYDDYGTSNTFTRDQANGTIDSFGEFATSGDSFTKDVSHGVSGDTYGFYDDEGSTGTVFQGDQALNGKYGWYLNGNDDEDANTGSYNLNGNLASGNTATGFYSAYGFDYQCACSTDTGSSFVNNKATNNGGDGFYDYWSINSTWSGNQASGNGGDGFTLDFPQNDVITGNTTKNNASTGIYLEDNNPVEDEDAQSFANNRADANGDYGLYGDYPQSGSGNVAKHNVPFDCWNVTCQAGATLAPAPAHPVSASRPSGVVRVTHRPQAPKLRG
jgi:hypothetical protein